MHVLRKILTLCALALLSTQASAQGAQVAFGGLKQDPTLPVEVTADQLQVDQNTGMAIFSGNVVIAQGEMRLTAPKVTVEYGDEGQQDGNIKRLLAAGGVTIVNGEEAAESRDAEYTIDTGTVVMTGNVILTQGPNALSSERLVIDLIAGTGTMDGRVKSVLQTGQN